MRKIECGICHNKDIPLNETIKIDGVVYCNPCFETQFEDQSKLEGKTIEKEFDPTICANCDKDFGETSLKLLSAYPICSECEITIRDKTFPYWVQAFLAIVLFIILVSFTWNWKYYSAYMDIKLANESYSNGNAANAAALFTSASEKVPEVQDLVMLSSYYRGLNYLYLDSSVAALTEFEKCKSFFTKDYGVAFLINQAQMGKSFDEGDYPSFLKWTKENYVQDSLSPSTIASVASAYACLFADQGNSEDSLQSVTYLNKAKAIDQEDEELKFYYNIIEYRLDSRIIITREEFKTQFPTGWTKN